MTTQPIPGKRLREQLAALDAKDEQYVPRLVDALLAAARETRASDIHLVPSASGLDVRWRIDGVLHAVDVWSPQLAPNVVARLKVVADMLTYRTDVPQEGRIKSQPGDIEMRVSTFPTLYGEKAVVRCFAAASDLLYLRDLGLPAAIEEGLRRLIEETSGMVLITGPAGAGKTTTAYACMRELVTRYGGEKSLVSIEDPVEVAVDGVAQSKVNVSANFDLAGGLRSLLRQDPEVILVGEIRDRASADGAFQASLTGHLVLTTYHAGSAAGAVSRLSNMGIEPYLLRSGLLAIVSQRLARKLCDCASDSEDAAARFGIPAKTSRVAVGCERCRETGYRGRLLIAEMLIPDLTGIGRAILSRSDAAHLEELAVQAGMQTRWDRALEAVESGQTSPAEIRRILGFSKWTN